MRSLGLSELLIVLTVIAIVIGLLKSIRKKNHGDRIDKSTSSYSGSSGYVRRHLGNCPGCGADLDTNDPHAPGCRRGRG